MRSYWYYLARQLAGALLVWLLLHIVLLILFPSFPRAFMGSGFVSTCLFSSMFAWWTYKQQRRF